MILAYVAIVELAKQRNWPEHGRYADGAIAVVEACADISAAERRAIELATERPLPQGHAYRPMHWLGMGSPKV